MAATQVNLTKTHRPKQLNAYESFFLLVKKNISCVNIQVYLECHDRYKANVCTQASSQVFGIKSRIQRGWKLRVVKGSGFNK